LEELAPFIYGGKAYIAPHVSDWSCRGWFLQHSGRGAQPQIEKRLQNLQGIYENSLLLIQKACSKILVQWVSWCQQSRDMGNQKVLLGNTHRLLVVSGVIRGSLFDQRLDNIDTITNTWSKW